MSRPVALLLLSFLIGLSIPAIANPRPLPFTYPSEMLNPGGLEIEQYADLTPVPTTLATGSQTTFLESTLITEIEYGLADRLELGLYFQFSNDPGFSSEGTLTNTPLGFDGIEQRLRYALAHPGEWPIDVELYGEVAEFQDELEVEAKIILQRRFGHVRLMLNLVLEHESYYTGRQEWVPAPTGGVAWEVVPWLNLGLEYWSHGESGGTTSQASETLGITPFNQAFHSYVGPTVMFQFRRLWWSVGPYVGVDQIGRTPQVGDQYGVFWLRSVIGIDFN